jgi:hypothetical protein
MNIDKLNKVTLKCDQNRICIKRTYPLIDEFSTEEAKRISLLRICVSSQNEVKY